MTTILCDSRLGVMVSDGAFNDGNCVGKMRKVWRVNGSLVGLAGNLDEFGPFLGWLKGGMKYPPPRISISALLLSESGILCFAASGTAYVVQSRCEAIGSGAMAAKSAHEALDFADPRKAVQIVTKHDHNSRGPVRVYKLKA
jgi:ATP-dependent protease HslVU (ClpYQ) peptidase subunit